MPAEPREEADVNRRSFRKNAAADPECLAVAHRIFNNTIRTRQGIGHSVVVRLLKRSLVVGSERKIGEPVTTDHHRQWRHVADRDELHASAIPENPADKGMGLVEMTASAKTKVP